MAQKSMAVQTTWRRWLIRIGSPVGVMAIVGDRGVMRCCAVWLIGPLIQGFVLWPQTAIIRCISIRSRSAPSQFGLALFGGLPEETCVRS